MATQAYFHNLHTKQLQPIDMAEVNKILNYINKKAFVRPQEKIDFYLNTSENFNDDAYKNIVDLLIHYQYELQVIIHISDVGDLYFVPE